MTKRFVLKKFSRYFQSDSRRLCPLCDKHVNRNNLPRHLVSSCLKVPTVLKQQIPLLFSYARCVAKLNITDSTIIKSLPVRISKNEIRFRRKKFRMKDLHPTLGAFIRRNCHISNNCVHHQQHDDHSLLEILVKSILKNLHSKNNDDRYTESSDSSINNERSFHGHHHHRVSPKRKRKAVVKKIIQKRNSIKNVLNTTVKRRKVLKHALISRYKNENKNNHDDDVVQSDDTSDDDNSDDDWVPASRIGPVEKSFTMKNKLRNSKLRTVVQQQRRRKRGRIAEFHDHDDVKVTNSISIKTKPKKRKYTKNAKHGVVRKKFKYKQLPNTTGSHVIHLNKVLSCQVDYPTNINYSGMELILPSRIYWKSIKDLPFIVECIAAMGLRRANINGNATDVSTITRFRTMIVTLIRFALVKFDICKRHELVATLNNDTTKEDIQNLRIIAAKKKHHWIKQLNGITIDEILMKYDKSSNEIFPINPYDVLLKSNSAISTRKNLFRDLKE